MASAWVNMVFAAPLSATGAWACARGQFWLGF